MPEDGEELAKLQRTLWVAGAAAPAPAAAARAAASGPRPAPFSGDRGAAPRLAMRLQQLMSQLDGLLVSQEPPPAPGDGGAGGRPGGRRRGGRPRTASASGPPPPRRVLLAPCEAALAVWAAAKLQLQLSPRGRVLGALLGCHGAELQAAMGQQHQHQQHQQQQQHVGALLLAEALWAMAMVQAEVRTRQC